MSTEWVYFVLDRWSRAVKIGCSYQPERRLKALQTAHPNELKLLFVIDAAECSEADFHERFAAAHLRGEWFEVKGELREFIEERLRAAGKDVDIPTSPQRHRAISVLQHPRRTEAEALIREGKLRAYQIAEQCDTSIDSIRRWARALGIERYKAKRPAAEAAS